MGAEKPSPLFFDRVASAIDGFDRSLALVIGDSLTSDIAGGIAAGIDTCWFNPRRKAPVDGIVPTYEIHALDELYRVLE